MASDVHGALGPRGEPGMIQFKSAWRPDNGAAPAFPILRLRESTKAYRAAGRSPAFKPHMPRRLVFTRDDKARDWGPTALPHTGKMLSIPADEWFCFFRQPEGRSIFDIKTTVLWLLGPATPRGCG